MQSSKPLCPHTKFLSKQSVKNLIANDPPKTCAVHTDLPLYYICLHCSSPICLQYQDLLPCLEYHQTTTSHNFFLQLEHGIIWCQLCRDTVQNQLFDYGPEDRSDAVLKLRRFEKCISEAWSQIAVRNGVEIGGVQHRGIKNLGNTCYLNAVLQSLFASEGLQQLYTKIQAKEDKIYLAGRIVPKEIEYFYDDVLAKNESTKWNIVSSKKQKGRQEAKKTYSKPVKNARFNIVFKRFMEEMRGKEKEKEALVPREILNILSEYNSKYREKEEQDAEELLLLIIDLLSEGQRINLLRDLQRYKEVQSILGFQKLTPTQSIFSFYLLNEIQCNQCKQTSRSLNLCSNLSLSLSPGDSQGETFQIQPKVSTVDIDYWQELIYPQSHTPSPFLSSFFKVQRLTKGQNYYQCGKCSSILAFRRCFIVGEPGVLVVGIKRFDAKLQKKSGFVEFPEEMSLEGVSLDKKPGKYQLYALIIHQGSTIASGHYTCIIRLNDQWLLCSDEAVQKVSWKHVKTQQPYVLLYQRLPQPE